MKNLKDLTPDECIKIACIVEPNVEWKFINSKNKWDGFDLIGKDDNEGAFCKNIFQIDYRSDEELQSRPRFRIYEDTYEYSVSNQQMEGIFKFLESI